MNEETKRGKRVKHLLKRSVDHIESVYEIKGETEGKEKREEEEEVNERIEVGYEGN